MDKELVSRRFAKSVNTYEQEAGTQHRIAERMSVLMEEQIPAERVERILEFGCGTGIFTSRLMTLYPESDFLVNDLCPEMLCCCQRTVPREFTPMEGDAETLAFPEGLSLIASCSAMQWFDDPEAFLAKCWRALDEDGILAFSTFGPDNIRELASLTGNGLRYESLEEMTSALEKNFRILHASESHEVLHFNSAMDVLRHLKLTGVTGLTRDLPTRAALIHLCRHYEELYPSPEGGVRLTYHPMYFIVEKRIP